MTTLKATRRKGILTLAILLSLAMITAGCAQDTETEEEAAAGAADVGTAEAATADAPAPFDEPPVKIAVVQMSGAGDYFQQWANGARQQLAALNVEYTWYDARADNAKQATDLEMAIGSGVQGIIISHGLQATMCPLINDALDAGISVVVFDVAIQECAPRAVQTQQSDADLADLSLSQMYKDIGSDQLVGYVNVLGIAPLDRRHVVWEEYLVASSWTQEFKVGVLTDSVATDNARLVDAALKANPDVRAIFAPFDEFTKGTVSAILGNDLEDQVWTYGIDFSNANIEIMIADNSPWKATAGTDPNAIGAAVVRTMLLELAGQQIERSVNFPGVLLTQTFLLDNNITNMVDLRAAMPELNLADVQSADWIPSVEF